MKNKKRMKSYLLSGLGGVIVGFISGFFGGGGGMIAVPILSKVLKLDTKQSHASAIFVILPISIASGIVYIINNGFNLTNSWYIILGVVVGGIIGATLLKKLSSKVIQIIFVIVMFVAGIYMCVK